MFLSSRGVGAHAFPRVLSSLRALQFAGVCGMIRIEAIALSENGPGLQESKFMERLPHQF